MDLDFFWSPPPPTSSLTFSPAMFLNKSVPGSIDLIMRPALLSALILNVGLWGVLTPGIERASASEVSSSAPETRYVLPLRRVIFKPRPRVLRLPLLFASSR